MMGEVCHALEMLENALQSIGASGQFSFTIPTKDAQKIEYQLSCAGLRDAPDLSKGMKLCGHEMKLEKETRNVWQPLRRNL